MRTINVLATQRISADDRAKIEASDPEIRLIDAGGWFDGEIGETWTAFAAARYLPPGATGSGSREERDRLLAETEVIIGGWPFPLDLRARAPRLKWLHQRQAGASNLLGSDLWGIRSAARPRRTAGRGSNRQPQASSGSCTSTVSGLGRRAAIACAQPTASIPSGGGKPAGSELCPRSAAWARAAILSRRPSISSRRPS